MGTNALTRERRSEPSGTRPVEHGAWPADLARRGRGEDLLAAVGNQALRRLLASHELRAKMEVGGIDDPAEREADRLAAASLQNDPPCTCSAGTPTCSACRTTGSAVVRRKPKARARGGAGDDVSLGASRPLDGAERSFFEERYRTDLSDVRIHDSDEAAASADALGARAFSWGSHVAFGRGEYRSGSSEGRFLLAHELAHVVRGHSGVRRYDQERSLGNQEQRGLSDDPCSVDVRALDNRALLQQFSVADAYLNRLIGERRRGEERFFDYQNLKRRLERERRSRARAGHVWLNADVADVPSTLWRLESSALGNIIAVTPGDISAAAANRPVGNAILLTPGQFSELLAREGIPTVDPAEFFSTQDPTAPTPLQLPVPERPETAGSPGLMQNVPFAADPRARFSGLGPWGTTAAGIVTPQTLHVYDPFTRPVVTGAPFSFAPDQIRGFRADWRGDIGEALFAAQDVETLRLLRDLNAIQQNAELFDFYDPRTGRPISVKTQLPEVAGGEASLASVQEAIRELFGQANLQKRQAALALLQASIDPTLTLDQMLLATRIAVNPENVVAAQKSLGIAIRRGELDYEPLLSAMLREQAVTVRHRNGSDVTYTDFATLHDDFEAGRIAVRRYRTAVGNLADRAARHIVSTGAGAETHLRPLVDYRQRFDFTGAAEFGGIPGTVAGRQQARALQELYFRRIAIPELLEIQTAGLRPLMGRAGRTGAAMGAGATALLELPQLIGTWEQDPYSGRRYLVHVALSGAGSGVQALGEQGLRIYTSQAALDLAMARAAAGRSVAPIATLAPAARFGGSTVLGGFASGGITIGGMWLDERYFGADYTRIDYAAKGTRAFVSGTVASGAGALASAGVAATLGGEGGAAGCTLVLPGGGTVACGVVGAVGGFIVGLGAYYLFDVTFGEHLEQDVREAMGEEGCTGRSTPAAEDTTSRRSLDAPIFACFPAGTPVLMADGGTRPIETLAVGDEVLAYDAAATRLRPAQIVRTTSHAPQRCLRIVMCDGVSFCVTANHLLYASRSSECAWVEAGRLRASDSLYRREEGSLVRVAISSIEWETHATPVFDVTVADCHNFFAAGVLAHNKNV